MKKAFSTEFTTILISTIMLLFTACDDGGSSGYIDITKISGMWSLTEGAMTGTCPEDESDTDTDNVPDYILITVNQDATKATIADCENATEDSCDTDTEDFMEMTISGNSLSYSETDTEDLSQNLSVDDCQLVSTYSGTMTLSSETKFTGTYGVSMDITGSDAGACNTLLIPIMGGSVDGCSSTMPVNGDKL